MENSIFSFAGFGFIFLNFLVWIHRTSRLLITLKRTPRIIPGAQPAQAPKVSVVIPAKNEEKNIVGCWTSLKKQDYPDLEIWVVNDNSTDQTGAILKSLGADSLGCPPCPQGWTGKNNALVYGVEKTSGDWLLFTDADTQHFPGSLSAAMAHADSRKLDFLTLLPRCITESFFEHLIQPAAMAFLGLWFPMEKVNDPASPIYFANGQYLLIRRSLYEKIGGHKAVAGEFLEDFALMKKAKTLGAPAECAFGSDVYGTRMYDSLKASWRGWRRIFLHAYERRPKPLLLNAASVFCFSFLPLSIWTICLIQNLLSGFAQPALLILASSLLVFMSVIGVSGYHLVRAKKVFALIHPFAAVFITLILLDAAGMAISKKPTFWR